MGSVGKEVVVARVLVSGGLAARARRDLALVANLERLCVDGIGDQVTDRGLSIPQLRSTRLGALQHRDVTLRGINVRRVETRVVKPMVNVASEDPVIFFR